MGLVFYNIFLLAFRMVAPLAAIFSPKAARWWRGRKNIFGRLREAIVDGSPVIWVHCASLGEFEQGRPLMESLKKNYPSHRMLLTFFSPSGYEVQKNYEGADWVFYLPLDGARSAKRFLEIVRPSLIVFIKYEYWYYYLKKAWYRKIPVLLVSAVFRPGMNFFKKYGGFHRKMLSRFAHLFVQDGASKELLEKIGFGEMTTVIGDTRFDRVIQVAAGPRPFPLIEAFTAGHTTLVAGSTWPGDEALLAALASSEKDLRIILAPHEVNEKHIADIERLFSEPVTRFSDPGPGSRIMIIDTVGILSGLYRYGSFCYVGGGLDSGGVHNVLEAAVYGKIVFYGPHHLKYREAVELAETGAGIVIRNKEELSGHLRSLNINDALRNTLESAAGGYVHRHRGATQKVMEYIQENRLLTN